MEAFVDAWQAGVVPLRERFGFQVEGAWVLEDSDEFVWILSYEGEDSFAAADAGYYGSAERAHLRPDPAQYIERAEEQRARRIV
jgi:hypothetical protein